MKWCSLGITFQENGTTFTPTSKITAAGESGFSPLRSLPTPVFLLPLQTLIPSDADCLKLRAEVDSKWRIRVASTLEDLEASKLSVQKLLQENLCLKKGLVSLGQEGNRAASEVKLQMEQKVGIALPRTKS